jgi:hypothetical protein
MARAAQAMAQGQAETAGARAGTLFGEGQAAQAQLFPLLTGALHAQHALTPTQQNELLTYAGAGAGGATGAFTGEESLNAARTRNTAGYQAALDRAQLGRQQALARASEGIGAEDVNLTEQNRQRAAAGLANLYGVDTGGALKSMGIGAEDTKNMIAAGQSGWFQDLMKMVSTGAQAYKDIATAGAGGGGGGGSAPAGYNAGGIT